MQKRSEMLLEQHDPFWLLLERVEAQGFDGGHDRLGTKHGVEWLAWFGFSTSGVLVLNDEEILDQQRCVRRIAVNDYPGRAWFGREARLRNVDSTAERSAKIYHDLANKGLVIDEYDCMIAGTVLSQKDGTLLTNNTSHFSRIDGFPLISFDARESGNE